MSGLPFWGHGADSSKAPLVRGFSLLDIGQHVNVGQCMDVGQCVNVHGSYFCLCLPPWTGRNCSQRVHVTCDDYSCLHNGTCQHDPHNSLDYCNCTGTGYTGTSCQLDIDECKDGGGHRCAGHSTCSNINGSYVCHCPPLYTGEAR